MEVTDLYSEVAEIIGQPCYLVGGSVRDMILGRECKDYDFCTPLLPDEIEERVRAAKRPSGDNFHVYTTGKRFGTIGFKTNSGEIVEVTTFRTEVYNDHSRKPTVEFVGDITHDLSRRDFTMNAIAYRDGRIIDPFGGENDMLRGVICAVGNARVRFKEDPLRMMRAARFASVFGFVVDETTEAAAERYSHRILRVAKERWMVEMDKILLSDSPTEGLDFLARTGVLKYVIPELHLQIGYNQNSKYHALPLWEHTLGVVSRVDKDINLRWAALLHDIGKPFVRRFNKKTGYHNYVKHDLIGAEIVEKTARHLKFSNERREAVVELVANHLLDESPLKAADSASKIMEVESA